MTEYRVFHNYETGQISVARDAEVPVAVCFDVVEAQQVADALNRRTEAQVKAEAWDEGWLARDERAHLKRGECVPAPAHIHPYRRVEAGDPR